MKSTNDNLFTDSKDLELFSDKQNRFKNIMELIGCEMTQTSFYDYTSHILNKDVIEILYINNLRDSRVLIKFSIELLLKFKLDDDSQDGLILEEIKQWIKLNL